MGRRPSRYDLSAAGREHAAAVARLQKAIVVFQAVGIPLSTDLGKMMQLWSREQVNAALELRDAWIELVETRRVYELLLRDDAA